MEQLALFPDRIAIDKNFSPNLSKDQEGEIQWAMDFQASFDIPREPINDILIFLLKKSYDNPLNSEITFTIKEIAKFHEKTTQVFNKLTLVEGPDKDKVSNDTYINNLEIILYRLATRNLQLSRSYIIPKGNKNELKKDIRTFQILNRFERTMLDGKTKKYTVSLDPRIVKNLSSFFFYTSHEDYKKVSSKGRKASSWKIYLMMLNNLFNNLQYNPQTLQPSFDELKKLLNLSPDSPAREHKRKITDATESLLTLPSLTGLKFKWIKSGKQRFAYTPCFYLDKERMNANPMIEDEKSKFRRVDLYLISELKEWNVPISREGLKEHGALFYKAFQGAYNDILRREAPSEEIREFFDTGSYKGKYDSFLKRYIN
ncbi:hypothetical protein AAOE16_18200 [Ekhidna sp. MALMAid0563]|uniref:hypothetical protein n=1 Tax=Ekhidna sp. MALMAid0563 TaxID=3143937 RepID=UPI0032DFACB2